MNRRGFLGGIIAAPWVVRSGILMPVKPSIILPVVAAPLLVRAQVLANGDTIHIVRDFGNRHTFFVADKAGLYQFWSDGSVTINNRPITVDRMQP